MDTKSIKDDQSYRVMLKEPIILGNHQIRPSEHSQITLRGDVLKANIKSVKSFEPSPTIG